MNNPGKKWSNESMTILVNLALILVQGQYIDLCYFAV